MTSLALARALRFAKIGAPFRFEISSLSIGYWTHDLSSRALSTSVEERATCLSDEIPFGLIDLGILRGIVGKEGQRPVLQLGGDQVGLQSRLVELALKPRQLLYLVAHARDYDQSEDSHRQQQKSHREVACEHLHMHANAEAGHDVGQAA